VTFLGVLCLRRVTFFATLRVTLALVVVLLEGDFVILLLFCATLFLTVFFAGVLFVAFFAVVLPIHRHCPVHFLTVFFAAFLGAAVLLLVFLTGMLLCSLFGIH